jgi:signal transduction histidine kinase
MPRRSIFNLTSLTASHQGRYWLSQMIGWSALALLSYLSLTLWYNPGELVPAVHTVLQSALGLMVSHPLRLIGRAVWTKPLPYRIAINTLAVAAAALIWTALRLQTFTLLTGERVDPGDWGGWFFASVMVFGSWLFCYHAVKFYIQATEQRERARRAEVKRLETEALFRETTMRMLKYQLNPHFLFNALNSVMARVQKGDQDVASRMLSRIAEFLRLSLDQDDRLEHALSEEERMSRLYLEIEKARFGNRLRSDFFITEEAAHAVVPALLLQPLIENAIKHGVGASLAPTVIEVRAERLGDRLRIEVRDDGPGCPSLGRGEDEGREGIGLKNVEERLRSVAEEDYVLKVGQTEPRGFTVFIDIPFRRMALEGQELVAAE